MDENEFKKKVDALILKKMEEIKTINEQASIYWNEITSRTYNFDRGFEILFF